MAEAHSDELDQPGSPDRSHCGMLALAAEASVGQEEPVGDGACLAVASAAVEPEHKYRSKRATEIGIQAASDELGRRMVAESLALVEAVHYTALVHGPGS